MHVLILYLSIGFLMNFIGPLAKKINDTLNKVKINQIVDLFIEKPATPFWKVILLEVTLRILIIIFYPLLYLVILIDYINEKKQNH